MGFRAAYLSVTGAVLGVISALALVVFLLSLVVGWATVSEVATNTQTLQVFAAAFLGALIGSRK